MEHVGAEILGVIPDYILAVGERGLIRGWLDVVIASAIEVILRTDDKAQLLPGTEAPAPGAVDIRVRAGIFERRVTAYGADAAHACDLEGWGIACGFGDKINGAANPVAVHVRLEGFAHLDRIDDPRGNSKEIEFTDSGIFGGHVKAIDGGIGQARLTPAHAHEIVLTLIARQGDAGHTADRIAQVAFRQAGDGLGGHDLDEVVRGTLFIDRLHFTRSASGRHQHALLL